MVEVFYIVTFCIAILCLISALAMDDCDLPGFVGIALFVFLLVSSISYVENSTTAKGIQSVETSTNKAFTQCVEDLSNYIEIEEVIKICK